MQSEGKSLHRSVVILLDIVLLGFGARGWEGFPTLRICVLRYSKEHILSYEDINENALIWKRSICMAFIYTKNVLGIKIMSVVERKL